MLNAAQIETYDRDGYLAIEDVLTGAELDELRQVTDEFVEKSRNVTSHDETFDLEPEHSAASPSLRRIKHPLTKHPVYARYARHDAILDIVECLLGPNLRFHNNKLNMKIPLTVLLWSGARIGHSTRTQTTVFSKWASRWTI